MPAMTLATLRSEVAAIRFNSTTDSARINSWINLAYAQLWGMADWIFRKASSSPTVTAGSRTLNGTPSLGFVSRGLWNETGDRLRYIPPDKFNDVYAGDTTTGTPVHYTIVNQAITVGPTPAADATWTFLYERRITQLTADAQAPLLPQEFHYLLVPGAIMLGGALNSDFTSQFIEAQWDRGIDAMRREYLVDVRGETTVWPSAPDGESSSGAAWLAHP